MAALKGVKTLDMVDGEITKVAYEGAEYERVEGDAEVGDLFLPRKGFHDMTAGSFYSVKEVDPDGDAYFFDDGGWSAVICSDDYFPFRKKRVRLKVGDYAKVVVEREISITGDIVKITEDDHGYIPFRCDVITGEEAGDYFWAQESDLVLATEDEVAAAKETEAKRSTEAKWAKIGRKVDEYKVGDLVKYLSDGEICEVGKITDRKVMCSTEEHGLCGELPKDITLITPVEARFDRS